MIGLRMLVASVAAAALVVFVGAASAGAAPSTNVTLGTAGATTAGCLAHVPGGLSEDFYDSYAHGCTGHDEPELDPVSLALRSAQNIT
jgi:hypothetical protein